MVWFVEGGKPYTAWQHIAAVLESLRGDVCVCDPYFGPGVLTAIQHLEHCGGGVRCLTRHLGDGGKATAEHAIRDFEKQFPFAKFRYINTGGLHDRYVFTDDNLLLLGHGLKGFGNKESFVVKLGEQHGIEDTITSVKSTFNSHWEDALPLG